MAHRVGAIFAAKSGSTHLTTYIKTLMQFRHMASRSCSFSSFEHTYIVLGYSLLSQDMELAGMRHASPFLDPSLCFASLQLILLFLPLSECSSSSGEKEEGEKPLEGDEENESARDRKRRRRRRQLRGATLRLTNKSTLILNYFVVRWCKVAS